MSLLGKVLPTQVSGEEGFIVKIVKFSDDSTL
jgi:hypothetical protein